MDPRRGEERVRCMERVTRKLMLPYVNQIVKGICCLAPETQKGELYQPRGVGLGGRYKREGVYVYLWLIHVEV